MSRPLGTGDVDVDAIVSVLGVAQVRRLVCAGEDTILTGEPPGEGPVADVRTSAEYVSLRAEQGGVSNQLLE